ncbi:hypothetical protein VP01_1068g3 [Puccinia sorghi]|uniref:Rho-GAP domain-containing protein n=1 Tax=Puccinia sorghi TaxID=27349 RepID=A0A0L6VTR4_9BASI|nr:hypothetical protein VP01_1068g3 [Puccinia sorghi]
MEMVMVRRRLVGRGGMGERSKRAVIEFEQVLRTQMGREELDVMHYLLELLGLFSVRSSDNLMNGKNLAIVFQPGIMQLSGADNPAPSMPPGSTRGSLLSGSHSPRLPPSSSDQSRTNSPAGDTGLHEYLGQIDEVQEVLTMLIDHFARLSHQPTIDDHPFIHFPDSPTPLLLRNPADIIHPISSTLSHPFSLPNSADDGG